MKLKARGESGSKDIIRRFMKTDLKWKSWRRKKLAFLTETHKKKRVAFAKEHRHWTADVWSNVHALYGQISVQYVLRAL